MRGNTERRPEPQRGGRPPAKRAIAGSWLRNSWCSRWNGQNVRRFEGHDAMGDGFRNTRHHVVQVGALWNRHAGNFHGNGGRGGGAQLADGSNERGIGGAPEAFRQLRLDEVAKFMAEADEGSLG